MIIISLTSCGKILYPSNKDIVITNKSNETITTKGDMGTIKINPGSDAKITTNKPIEISAEKKCAPKTIDTQTNTAAMVLDIFPGYLLLFIPIWIDSSSGNLYEIPETYNYECI